ncbi:ScyD/ScyE family protein [Pseudarthrobacter sp. P1]|uniref:ScyD/ScyE family protein n=1 Tax=Pseudarthrobacter sp. P1 TaxID=3418418 RepID=UPI003CF61B22
MHRSIQSAAAAFALAATIGFGAGPATAAAPQHSPDGAATLASGLLSPLSLAAGNGGTVYVAQNFGGTLTAIDGRGATGTIYQSPTPGSEVGAVSVHDGTLYFSDNAGVSPTSGASTAKLMAISRHDGMRTITDLARYEATENPDADVAYGFRDLDTACLAQLPPDIPGAYTGTVDSHVYATAPGRHELFVADAGGNDILAVDPDSGDVRTVAVLPPQPAVVTAEAVAALGLPACTLNHRYYFEPVPTDVAVGPDGLLYVSTLPGGPEGPQLGARGKIYSIDPSTGSIHRVVSGLLSPTGLAITGSGDIYVAELFGDRISVARAGDDTAEPFLSLPHPAALVLKGSTLYATVDVLPAENMAPNGRVVAIGLDDWR